MFTCEAEVKSIANFTHLQKIILKKSIYKVFLLYTNDLMMNFISVLDRIFLRMDILAIEFYLLVVR
jgi:hypothetical protein